MAIIVEDGTGKADAQSYCSKAYATDYLTKYRVHSGSWDDSDYQEAALVWATSLLDQHVEWYGSKLTDEQRLRWPRSGMVDPDGWGIESNEIPESIKMAVAEYAYILLGSDRVVDPGTMGFSEIKVGPINLKIDKHDTPAPLPDSVFQMVSHFGTRKSAGGSVVRLHRV